MRGWLVGSATCVVLAAAAIAFSSGRGQPPASNPLRAKNPKASLVAPVTSAAEPRSKGPDVAKFSAMERDIYASARGGADWLCRANRPDGHFAGGLIPSLKTAVEGDHDFWQAEAALALARTARFAGDERYGAIARQAILTLLLDTALDPHDPQVRRTVLPSSVLNRVEAAGRLILAINELPSPGVDLLQQSEQLCAFLRSQQQADGSLRAADLESTDADANDRAAGEALRGLAVSQRHQPAAWKNQCLRKACLFYRSAWQNRKNVGTAACHIAACAEAYRSSGDKVFADGAFEMSDWLCGLQYAGLDAQHPFWQGGFMGWKDGRCQPVPPAVDSARCGEALAQAAAAARQARDPGRGRRYGDAAEACLQFVIGLQYAEAGVQHFADWYRPALVGGFHASHADGTLRLDYTAQAVGALIQYLSVAAELGEKR
jgi:hypothetical protein